jgi:hypothetical protein
MLQIGSRLRAIASASALVFLAACASGVTRSDNIELAKPHFADAGRKAGGISVSFSPEGQKSAADNIKFNQETLLSTVRRALEANDVLTKETDPTLAKIEIIVTSVRVRSAFSAVMFGFMAGDDHIKGDVVVRDQSGREIQRFGVGASYALGGLAGGMDETRMGWLYETFAKHVLEELKGTPSS